MGETSMIGVNVCSIQCTVEWAYCVVHVAWWVCKSRVVRRSLRSSTTVAGLVGMITVSAKTSVLQCLWDKSSGKAPFSAFPLTLAVNIQLPTEHLETYYALLKSNDLEVQRISSLSLVTFLLKGNGELIFKRSHSRKGKCYTELMFPLGE